MQIIKIQEARDKGLTHYFTGKPCPQGHISKRLVSKRSCCICNNLRLKDWAAKNKDKIRAYDVIHGRNSYKKHKDKRLKYGDEYRKNNPEKRKQTVKNWATNNKDKLAATQSKRRATVKNALPLWANILDIRNFFEGKPQGFHVDHIIPLTNKLVCGLHVLNNLQYLKAAENFSKNNSFVPYVEKINGEIEYLTEEQYAK